MANYSQASTKNLISQWVQVWVPEYNPSKGPGEKVPWEIVAGFHGLSGQVIKSDDKPHLILTAFKVEFDDGRSVWCWRRELRPAKSPPGQPHLL